MCSTQSGKSYSSVDRLFTCEVFVSAVPIVCIYISTWFIWIKRCTFRINKLVAGLSQWQVFETKTPKCSRVSNRLWTGWIININLIPSQTYFLLVVDVGCLTLWLLLFTLQAKHRGKKVLIYGKYLLKVLAQRSGRFANSLVCFQEQRGCASMNSELLIAEMYARAPLWIVEIQASSQTRCDWEAGGASCKPFWYHFGVPNSRNHRVSTQRTDCYIHCNSLSTELDPLVFTILYKKTLWMFKYRF